MDGVQRPAQAQRLCADPVHEARRPAQVQLRPGLPVAQIRGGGQRGPARAGVEMHRDRLGEGQIHQFGAEWNGVGILGADVQFERCPRRPQLVRHRQQRGDADTAGHQNVAIGGDQLEVVAR